MPSLPVLSGKQVIERFELLGFEQVRQRGSHLVMRWGSAGTVVPLHRELKAGTLAGILRQAGIAHSQFEAAS